jgi:hypothetical protein
VPEQLIWILLFVLIYALVFFVFYLVQLVCAVVLRIVLQYKLFSFPGLQCFDGALLIEVVVVLSIEGISDFFLLEKIRAYGQVRKRLLMAVDKIKLRGSLHFIFRFMQ